MANKLTLEEESNVQKVGKGAYVNECTVTNVEDFSNYPGQQEIKTIGQKGFAPELCLVVHYLVEGFDKERKTMLFGKFKKTAAGVIQRWDSWNNSVQRFLVVTLADEAMVEDDLTISVNTLKKCINKRFKVISYQSDRPYTDKEGNEKYSYQTWQKVFDINATLEEMSTEWNNGVGYLNDYAPHLVPEKNDTSFNYGANVPANEYDVQKGSEQRVPDEDLI